jgi:hypothetical protein
MAKIDIKVLLHFKSNFIIESVTDEKRYIIKIITMYCALPWAAIYAFSVGFLHQENWPPWYNWHIVESGVKHH